MTSKRCPECGLVNPSTGMTCDCGWSFVTNQITSTASSHREDSARRSQANGQIAFGALLLVIGVVITAATYSSVSQSGGTYILAWGPIVVGIIKIVRGVTHLNR